MKIQFFSDVHLEFGPAPLPHTDADVIIAAGDVNVGASGVAWLKSSGKPTIYVAGNHEFYGGDLHQVQNDIRAAVAGSAVRFLECDSVEIDGVRFLGTTLWTDFMGRDAEVMDNLRENMNDYHQISIRGRMLEPADLADINGAARAWLETQLATRFDGPTVVVTHHAPLFASWRANPDSPFRPAYCNDLSHLVHAYPVALWVHGHVHARSDYQANDLRVVCNPRGYDGYQLVDGFDITRYVEIS
ncbi:MAG: metallophosphoesterase family protein [Gammaproteobacteria bacterium]|nr:metallophosphoesterase family protein [Gammaproteobacteria bacterium]